MVRGALTVRVYLEEDLEVVAEVSQGDQVLLTAKKPKPDIAFLDNEMPGSDGLSAAEALHKNLPSCRIVVLTTFGRSGYLRRAMKSSAVGFLLKDAPAEQLAIAIRRVMAGERAVDPELALSALTVLPTLIGRVSIQKKNFNQIECSANANRASETDNNL